MASPDSAGVPQALADATIVVPLDNLQAVEKAFELHGKDIAAVMIEAIPANNGLLLQKDGFNRHVMEIAKKNGALVIYDEVITGFRVGFGGMAEREGVTPDLVCYGKIIGGGFPVGAYGGRADLMDLVAPAGPVYQAGTLSANPVAMSAGLAMLKKLKRDNPYPKLEARTTALADQLEKLAQKAGAQVKVQRFASMFWAVLGEVKTSDGVVRTPEQTPSTQKERYAKAFHSVLADGIYMAPSGYEVSFLSTAHTDADLERFLKAFEKTL
jgi:glutamate-1-semialdehyde 2,1-aminomutase